MLFTVNSTLLDEICNVNAKHHPVGHHPVGHYPFALQVATTLREIDHLR